MFSITHMAFCYQTCASYGVTPTQPWRNAKHVYTCKNQKETQLLKPWPINQHVCLSKACSCVTTTCVEAFMEYPRTICCVASPMSASSTMILRPKPPLTHEGAYNDDIMPHTTRPPICCVTSSDFWFLQLRT